MASTYNPDRWMLVKLNNLIKPENTHYRVFAVWYGGFTQGESWKLNSGITGVEDNVDKGLFEFMGSSGSVYYCHKKCYGTSGYGFEVLSNLIKNNNSDGLLIEPIHNMDDSELANIPQLLKPYLND